MSSLRAKAPVGEARSVDLLEPSGKKAGSVELPAEVFDRQANTALMHQVVVAQLAAARRGTHKTKTRAEVSGGGAKPYRQKGTGRARQGSTRAPQFTGGGVVHGPQPRDYSQRTPKKMKAAALRGALSDRARGGRVHVVSSFVSADVPSTKEALAVLNRISEAKRVLVVLDRADENAWKSLRNSDRVHLIFADQLNTYDVLVSDDVIFTKPALEAFIGGAAAVTESVVVEDSVVGDEAVEAKPAKAKKAEKSEKAAAKAEPATAPAMAEPADEAPFGEGSHAPLEDGSQPDGFPIKGNADSKLYHVPDSRFYDQTVAEVWFSSEEAAEAAGFELPKSQRKKSAADDSAAEENGEEDK